MKPFLEPRDFRAGGPTLISAVSVTLIQPLRRKSGMSRSFSWPALVALVAVLAGSTGCAGIPASAPEEEPARSARAGEYRIGAADVLQISVWKNETLSRTVPVRPDGMISLPLVNEIRAEGLTPRELREVLTAELEEYVSAPEVSVIVEEVHSFAVSVLGEVKDPGRYELASRTTVLDMLAMAGDVTEFAARSRIVILRPDGDTMRRIPFDYEAISSADGVQANFFVQPGDIILVP